METNTLFVSAYLSLKEDRSKDKSVQTCFNHFKNLASSGIPILLFLSKSYEEAYRGLGTLPNVRMEFLEFEDLQTYRDTPENVRLPINRTPCHDTRNFMILMNAKIEFVRRALDIVPEATHVAWIDFSICHVFKQTEQSLAYLSMLHQSRLKQKFIAFPGCYDITQHPLLYTDVFWRFCGGFFIGDRESLNNWSTFYRSMYSTLVQQYGLMWEVNIWTMLENLNNDLFRPTWFKADHNDSIIKLPSSCYSIVACLTTIPSRIGTDCVKAITSIQDQVDQVYLAVSPSYKRFPDISMNIPDFGSKVTVVMMPDNGPANKYLVSLNSLIGHQWIFFCDDDQEYKEGLVQKMMDSVTDLAVYQNRLDIIRTNTSGGLIHGFVGNLVHRSLLKGLDKFELPDCSRYTDDQWMSIFYYLNGVRIKGTGIENYSDIYRTLEQGHERYSIDSLASLGTRADMVRQVGKYWGIRFTGDYDNTMMFLTDVPGVEKGTHQYPVINGYMPSSSSFITVEGQNYLNVRYVNYLQTPEGQYIIMDPKGALRTENVIMELDASFQQVSTHFMNVVSNIPVVGTEINGLEDIRLYKEQGQLRFIATQRQWTHQSRMVIGDISGTNFQNITILEPPAWTGCEKNWIPVEGSFIYKWHPIQLYTPENRSIVREWPTPRVFEHIRGSTILLPFGSNEQIGVVHSSVEGSPRHYYHRLVVLDSAYRLLRYTAPFVFGRIGIEFCIGFALLGDRIRFWYSQHDRDPVWLSVPLASFTFLDATNSVS